MIKLIIFDLDGTLIDSADGIIATVRELCQNRKIDPPNEMNIKNAIGEGLFSFLDKTFHFNRMTPVERTDLEAEFLYHYERNFLQHNKIFPGVMDFIHSWQGQKAIVTNKSVRHTDLTLKSLPLGQLDWIAVFGADALPKRKPDALPLLESMARAKVSPQETLMVGDGLPDIIAARQAGVRSIACLYGYAREELLRAEMPSFVAHRFEDISTLVQEAAKS